MPPPAGCGLAGGWLGVAGWPGGGNGTPNGVGSLESAQALPTGGSNTAEIRIPTPSKAASVTWRLGLDDGKIGLLQGEPVIRDLQFHLLRGRRQLVGAKEHDPASEDQDDDTDKGEEWLAHV